MTACYTHNVIKLYSIPRGHNIKPLLSAEIEAPQQWRTSCGQIGPSLNNGKCQLGARRAFRRLTIAKVFFK